MTRAASVALLAALAGCARTIPVARNTEGTLPDADATDAGLPDAGACDIYENPVVDTNTSLDRGTVRVRFGGNELLSVYSSVGLYTTAMATGDASVVDVAIDGIADAGLSPSSFSFAALPRPVVIEPAPQAAIALGSSVRIRFSAPPTDFLFVGVVPPTHGAPGVICAVAAFSWTQIPVTIQ